MLDFLVIMTLVCLITLWLQSRPFIWKGKGIKWKLPLPFMGNTSGLMVKPWHVFWRQFYADTGDHRVIGLHMFSNPALLIKDPKLLKKVMVSDADYFTARELHQDEIDPIGRSLFFTKGSEWKGQRTKMTPYFTPSRIKAMMPFLRPVVDMFVQAIDEQARQGPVDVKKVSLQLATDVITSNVFGLEPEAFKNPDSFFYHLQSELICFDTGLRAMVGILSPPIYRLLRLTFFRPSTIAKLTGFVTEVISQRSKGVGTRPDFMQGMMELLDEKQPLTETNGKVNHRNLDSAEKFDRKTVVGQCMLLYTAGTETTGNTLSFLMFELAFHQEAQDKLRSEIITMLKTTGDEFAVEDLHRLPYMQQVISEGLRKYPVATFIGRKCTRPYNLDGLEIPVGTIVTIPIVGIHHDPNNYPNPNKFDPERFSPGSDLKSGTYLPFGLGPRTCIGMKFALTELMLALVKLLPKYKLVPCSETPKTISFATGPMLTSAAPLFLTIQPLSN